MITSKLTNAQLLAVAQQVLNPRDADHVKWYFTRGTANPDFFRQDAIQFITKRAGKTPDQLADGIVAAQIRREEEAKKPVQAASDAIAVRIVDLSAPTSTPQDPRAAVFIDCPVCGKQFAVPVAQKDSAFCSPKCFGAAKNQAANDEHAMLVFMQNTPQFYPCEVNFKEIGDQLERWKKTNVTTADILEAYRNLIQQGKLLKRLTDADLRAMSSAEVAAREKVDPGFGGLKLVQEGQRHLQGAFQADTTNATRLLPFAAKGSIGGRGGKEGL
jgi:endogenous inhibitor of DNA gyrase (YacG/DUF329 family)